MPLKHLWRYHVRWWNYACSKRLDINDRREAFAEAHRAARAAVQRTEHYL